MCTSSTRTLLAGATAALLMAAPLWLMAPPAQAHHSYADFDRAERFELDGVITAVHWGNPHILLTIDNGEHPVRVEWVTTAGADKTGVQNNRFVPGDRITVVGSRHRNPSVHTMTLVKELRLPQHQWQWLSPSLGSRW
jgi:hypothetical protein